VFLCLQTLFGRSFVVMPILATFLLPLGLGLHSFWPSFPPYVLPLIPLGLLAAIVAWVLLLQLGVLPPKLTPWSLTPVSLWLDICSLCQDTPETITAGVEGFKRFIDGSNKMVAFVSGSYFARLWCVYELAYFCSKHGQDLDHRLLLLSLHWPSTLSPFKSKGLSDDRRAGSATSAAPRRSATSRATARCCCSGSATTGGARRCSTNLCRRSCSR